MKHFLNLLLVTALSAPAGQGPIRTVLLDERQVHPIAVATNRVTTVSFPSAIGAIDAAGVTADPKVPAEFHLAHTPGTAFLSLRAMRPGARANLNVRFAQKTFVLDLIESADPVLSLNFEQRKPVTRSTPLTAPAAIALLDRAKAYPILKQQAPETVEGVDARTYDHPAVTEFETLSIGIEEAFRFEKEDALVFRLLLTNKTDTPIRYRPGSFALRVGNRLYPQTISDASGVLNKTATVYFAVVGTPDGSRNDISLKNDFAVALDLLP